MKVVPHQLVASLPKNVCSIASVFSKVFTAVLNYYRWWEFLKKIVVHSICFWKLVKLMVGKVDDKTDNESRALVIASMNTTEVLITFISSYQFKKIDSILTKTFSLEKVALLKIWVTRYCKSLTLTLSAAFQEYICD